MEKQNDIDDHFDSGYARERYLGDIPSHTYTYERPSKIRLVGYTECSEKLARCLSWTSAPTIKSLPQEIAFRT